MADLPPNPETNDDSGDDITPRWVKVFGIIGIVLVLLFVILHLAGGGFRGHMHGSGTPDQTSPASLTDHGVQKP